MTTGLALIIAGCVLWVLVILAAVYVESRLYHRTKGGR